MLTQTGPRPAPDQLYKIEQTPHTNAQSWPSSGALLLDILKTLETQLQHRNFLPKPEASGIHPLWFIAENECNLYLWKNGLSLSDKPKFEFWIHLQSLAKKRLHYLGLLEEGFIFTNPTWGLGLPAKETIEAEHQYLQTFLKVTANINKHIYALSKSGLLLRKEFKPETAEATVVLLPG